MKLRGKSNLFQQLKQGLAKTRGRLSNGLKSLLLGKSRLDTDLLEDIEIKPINNIWQILELCLVKNNLTFNNYLTI